MLVVENNNIGYSVLDKLIDYAYPNLYHSIKSTHEYIEQYQAEYNVQLFCPRLYNFNEDSTPNHRKIRRIHQK